MKIVKQETTIIPQSFEGIKFAEEYEERLKKQGAFRGRNEDTQVIIIKSEYVFGLVEGE